MPFEEIETVTKANTPPTAVLTYMPNGHAKTAGKHERKPSLKITMPTTICGTSKSETFRLLIGSGSDAGKLRIQGMSAKDAAKSGAGCKPAQMKHSFRWNFGFVPKLGDDIFDGERRPVRKISDEEFEIEVPPNWFEESAS